MFCGFKKFLFKDFYMLCLIIFEFFKFRESENKFFYRFKIVWMFIYGGLDVFFNLVCVYFIEGNYY